MRMLDDRPIVLPFLAVVPWPYVEYQGQQDWISSCYCVESWLDQCVGAHLVRWAWSMWALHQSHLCAVSFARSQDSTLFLLRFG
jgi:hypothetical protein